MSTIHTEKERKRERRQHDTFFFFLGKTGNIFKSENTPKYHNTKGSEEEEEKDPREERKTRNAEPQKMPPNLQHYSPVERHDG